jgi:hypothetical protein
MILALARFRNHAGWALIIGSRGMIGSAACRRTWATVIYAQHRQSQAKNASSSSSWQRLFDYVVREAERIFLIELFGRVLSFRSRNLTRTASLLPPFSRELLHNCYALEAHCRVVWLKILRRRARLTSQQS